jgi:Histidine phosphatase superfamily (branch 2)
MPLTRATRRTSLRSRSAVYWWHDREKIQKSKRAISHYSLCSSSNSSSPTSLCCYHGHELRRFFCSSSTGDKDDDSVKNMGTIVAAWVFCRHGDRTPSRPLCPVHRQEEEAHFWLTKLPYPSTATVYTDFSQTFPPAIENPTGQFMDVHRNPFGFITHKGLLQMQENGRQLRQRYDPTTNTTTTGNHDSTSTTTTTTRRNNNNNNLLEPGQSSKKDELFLKQWRIDAYSTNYLRTILSMQSLLDGLLHTQLYMPDRTRDNMDYTNMKSEEWPVPDHTFINSTTTTTTTTPSMMDSSELDDNNNNNNNEKEQQQLDDHAYVYNNNSHHDPYREPSYKDLHLHRTSHSHNNAQQQQQQSHNNNNNNNPKVRKPKVVVRVRDQSCDNLNAFDRNPELMRDLVSHVMESKPFKQEDGAAAPVAARLANILPGLARKGRKDFSARTPSGINWVEAADHFVCRTAHDLKLSKFSDSEHDDNVEQLLSAMTYKALGHLAWRFRQWYQNPQLLAAIAAPPLREIAQQSARLVESSSSEQREHQHGLQQDPNKANFLCLYSCHDVTLLALLYALGADFLADDTSAVWREYWPEYASTLTLELVRLDDDSDKNKNNNNSNNNRDLVDSTDQEAPRHIMRVMINGKVVTSTDFLLSKFEREKTPSTTEMEELPLRHVRPLGRGPYNLLTIQDFWNMITTLESMGEYDFSRWPAMKEESDAPGGHSRRKQKQSMVRRETSLNSSLN